MNDILTQLAHTPWWEYVAVTMAVALPFLPANPVPLYGEGHANPVEDRSIMPSATRQTGETKAIPDPVDTTGSLDALVSPDKTGAFLTEEDVDRVTTELLRVANDLTIDLAHNGTSGRADALMRADVSARLTSVAALLLDRARTTP